MRTTLLTLSFLFTISFVYSQELTKGYVVKYEGDTLRGWIREQEEWITHFYLEFSESPTSTPVEISLRDDVDFFYLEKHKTFFYSRTLYIDKKPSDLYRLESTPERKFTRERIVMRLLVKGAVNLFDYADEDGKLHYFVQKGTGDIVELSYVRYLAGGSRLVEMPYFVEPLKMLLSDCNKVGTISTSYTERALKRVINQYNSCSGSDASYQITIPKNHVRLSVFAGGGTASPNFKGNGLVGNNQNNINPNIADFARTDAVEGGLNLEFISGKRSRFVPGIQVSYRKTGLSYAEQILILSKSEMWMGDFHSIVMMPTLKYNLISKSRFTAYLSGGVGLHRLLKATSTYVYTDFIFNTKTEPRDFAEYKKVGISYFAGAGASFGRLFLELRFQQSMNSTITRQRVQGDEGQGVSSNVVALLGFRLTRY